MKEYTLLSAASVVIIVVIDRLSRIRLTARPEFYIFLAVIFTFKLLVNGIMTSSGITMYSSGAISGLNLGTIPLEDFLFGFSMVTLTLICWEYFKRGDV